MSSRVSSFGSSLTLDHQVMDTEKSVHAGDGAKLDVMVKPFF